MTQQEKPMFLADWTGVMFIHFRIDPQVLAPVVPFDLDVRDGAAYVSLVAFTQRRLRPSIGGRLAALLSKPLAEHEFLNLRTYVRVGDERGICFISEWIPNRLAVLIGPRMYGLPYRLGALRYHNEPSVEAMSGRVVGTVGAIEYRAEPTSRDLRPATDGSLDQFLLERFTAYTHRNGIARRFRVSHAPWPQMRVNVEMLDMSLLTSTGLWTRHLELIGANFSPGVRDVGIGPPEKMHARNRKSQTENRKSQSLRSRTRVEYCCHARRDSQRQGAAEFAQADASPA